MSEIEEISGIVTKIWDAKEIETKSGAKKLVQSIEVRGYVTDENKPIRFSCWPFEKDAKTALNRVFHDVQEGDRVKFEATESNGYYNINSKEPIQILEHGVKPKDTDKIAQNKLPVDPEQSPREALQPVSLMDTCLDNAIVMYSKRVPEEVREYVTSDPNHMQNVIKLAACLSVLACRKKGI